MTPVYTIELFLDSIQARKHERKQTETWPGGASISIDFRLYAECRLRRIVVRGEFPSPITLDQLTINRQKQLISDMGIPLDYFPEPNEDDNPVELDVAMLDDSADPLRLLLTNHSGKPVILEFTVHVNQVAELLAPLESIALNGQPAIIRANELQG